MKNITKPIDGVAEFYKPYMAMVPGDGKLLQHLGDILIETEGLALALSEEQLNYSYAPGKWTIKDVLLHLADCERILIYRVTRIARGDKTDLPGFDEELLALNANAGKRNVNDILNELKAFRASTLVFLDTLDDEALDRTGTANNYPLSARLLANHIYGHHRHHLDIIKERYLRIG
jgi:uncharacterized damage-inducible protein DinB